VHPRTATCLAAPSPTSLLRRAPALLGRASDPVSCLGGLRCCHVSHDSGPTSLLGTAPVLPRAPRLQTLPPYSGELRRCHVSRGPQRVIGLRNKERLTWLSMARPHVSKARPNVFETPDT
jgi:hypothetical protein